MKKQQEWQLQDAKNRFSELVKLAQLAPQTVTVHGKPSVVIISCVEYRALIRLKRSLLDTMRSAPKAFGELDIERVNEADMREVTF